MLWVGVNPVELGFLVFLALTVAIGLFQCLKNVYEKSGLSLMWGTYGITGLFFLLMVESQMESWDALLLNFDSVVRNWK